MAGMKMKPAMQIVLYRQIFYAAHNCVFNIGNV